MEPNGCDSRVANVVFFVVAAVMLPNLLFDCFSFLSRVTADPPLVERARRAEHSSICSHVIRSPRF